MPLSTNKKHHFSTAINLELYENFLREAYWRDLYGGDLLEEILIERYRKKRYDPRPLLPGEKIRNELDQKDLSKCEY